MMWRGVVSTCAGLAVCLLVFNVPFMRRALSVCAAKVMSWIEEDGIDIFRGQDLTHLKQDEALLNLSSSLALPYYLYSLSEDCYKCPFQREVRIDPQRDTIIAYPTKRKTTFRVLADGDFPYVAVDDTGSAQCEIETDMGEFGVYDFRLEHNILPGRINCEFREAKEPVNIYLPILVCVLFFLGLALLLMLTRYLYVAAKRKRVGFFGEGEEEEEERKGRKRVKALDTFRGISIIVMIFVNDGAGGYWFLEHATWNGLQIADLVFPWFMWIMGVCIPISLKSQLKNKVPRYKIFLNVFRRSCILFLLGLILNTKGVGPNMERLRIFGVLQRFGITYLVVTTIALLLTKRQYDTYQSKVACAMQDVIVLIPQWVAMLLIVMMHCLITFLLEVPGCPTGYLGPAGIQDNGIYAGCAGGATGYIDREVLGLNHIYQHPTSNEVYKGGPFDPEGILGCVLSVFQVFLGLQAGTTLLFHREWRGRVCRWMTWGILTGIIGAILCLGSKEDGWIPLNKNLWSLSFVMVTSSFAFILLSICYIFIDVLHWWSGSPFYYPGMNATIMYMGHQLAAELFPWHFEYGEGTRVTHMLSLVEALWGTSLWVLIAMWLHHHKFFLSI